MADRLLGNTATITEHNLDNNIRELTLKLHLCCCACTAASIDQLLIGRTPHNATHHVLHGLNYVIAPLMLSHTLCCCACTAASTDRLPVVDATPKHAVTYFDQHHCTVVTEQHLCCCAF